MEVRSRAQYFGRIIAQIVVLLLSSQANALTRGDINFFDSVTLLIDAQQTPNALAEAALRRTLIRGLAQTPTIRRVLHGPKTRLRSWVAHLKYNDDKRDLHRGKPILSPSFFDIPIHAHPLVASYIHYFTHRGRGFFSKWLARSDVYAPIMRRILQRQGIPQDMVYLAMIESGFTASAYSSSGASGFWQFISSTGRQYALQQNTWVDDRRDFVRATYSAARFLTDLKRRFGDWHLAWAGYNAGGGRISRAMQREHVTDFWTLADNPLSLPKETRHYVPKIIAAAIVAKNRDYYSFAKEDKNTVLRYETITVDHTASLPQLASYLGVTPRHLKRLNPALLHQRTPPKTKYPLRVPLGTVERTKRWLSQQRRRTDPTTYISYTVRKGNTLSSIAKRFRSTKKRLATLNAIDNPHQLRTGRKILVPQLALLRQKRSGISQLRQHTVAAGDTLWSIARRYNVSVGAIKRHNGRRHNRIMVGETLRVF